MKRTLMVIAAAVAMLFGFNAMASAAPQEEVATFVLNPVDPALNANAGAASRGWDKNTVVDLPTRSCSGYRCVTVTVDPNSCGSAGCATTYSDGSCLVQVTPAVMEYPEDVESSTVAHEVGHCMGLPHSDNNRSIMWWQLNTSPPNWIIAEDRRNLNAIYSTSALTITPHLKGTKKSVVSRHAFALAS